MKRQQAGRDRYKRPFDLGMIAVAVVLLLPVWVLLSAVIAVAIRLESPGPVMYRQERLGRNGRVFRMIKFRTMVDGAEAYTGPVWAAFRDSRTTRVGRVLRRLHLDELPQLVNVMRGEMSLVGPRPERPILAARIEREVPGFSRRLRVRPGIMGMAQACGRYHLHPRRKLRYDNLYIATMSPWLDIRLCVLCVCKVLLRNLRPHPSRPSAEPAAEPLAAATAPAAVTARPGPGRRRPCTGLEPEMTGAMRGDAGTGTDAGTGCNGSRTRYFQIGFQKCGTTTIAAFFNRCGIPCVHHDHGRLARRMRLNLAAGARPLEGYETYAAFTNMNLTTADDYFDGFKHYLALQRAYGGRFILNTRPVEHWVHSLMTHKVARLGKRKSLEHYILRFGTADPGQVAECWRVEWHEHHRKVLDELSAEDLLVFNIESDPPERLCDFVGLPRSCARHYRVENPSMNRLGRLVGACVPLAVKRRIPNGMKQPLKRLLRAP